MGQKAIPLIFMLTVVFEQRLVGRVKKVKKIGC